MNYNNEEKILIWLSSFEFIQSSKVHLLLEKYETVESLFNAILKRDLYLVKAFSNHFNELLENANWEYINSYILNLNSQGVTCLTFKSKGYSSLLKEIYNPPINLYLKGDISLLNTRSVGIVGTRNPTNYGKTVTYDFSKSLAKAGVTIVSGLAMGVDKVAHQACLEAGGKTIAVLGSGFNHIYPAINHNLAYEIEKKGLIVSEFPPQATPQKQNFPIRNRIIAGLSEGVLLTEAGEKSGTLYTKEYAVENNRNVYVIPGNVNSIMSKGTNNLIKNFQGICVLSYKDILLDMNIVDGVVKKVTQLDFNQQLVFACVEKESLHFEEIANKTKLDSKTLNSCLTTMAIRGIIKKLPGNHYSI